MDYRALAHLYDGWIDAPGYPLTHDFPEAEYAARLARSRARMTETGLDALVITSGVVGQWFTSRLEPHEWHDRCQARSAWYVLSHERDVLLMSPTAAGEHFNTTRRSTWVREIRGIAERTEAPDRVEIWALEQMPAVFDDLGLAGGRLGFELGDCMTLGLSVLDFLRLRDLMPRAELVDGSAVIRRLMSVLTPWEIDQLRTACVAADWMHEQVSDILQSGMAERELFARLEARFPERYDEPYAYSQPAPGTSAMPERGSMHAFHAVATDREYRPRRRRHAGIQWRRVQRVRGGHRSRVGHRRRVARGPRPLPADLGMQSGDGRGHQARHPRGRRLRGRRADRGAARVSRAPTGRTGHGFRNTGGLSVHPDNQTVLEPGMVISVEPMFPTIHGFFDLEDQYLVTEAGAECLHRPRQSSFPSSHEQRPHAHREDADDDDHARCPHPRAGRARRHRVDRRSSRTDRGARRGSAGAPRPGGRGHRRRRHDRAARVDRLPHPCAGFHRGERAREPGAPMPRPRHDRRPGRAPSRARRAASRRCETADTRTTASSRSARPPGAAVESPQLVLSGRAICATAGHGASIAVEVSGPTRRGGPFASRQRPGPTGSS